MFDFFNLNSIFLKLIFKILLPTGNLGREAARLVTNRSDLCFQAVFLGAKSSQNVEFTLRCCFVSKITLLFKFWSNFEATIVKISSHFFCGFDTL